MNRNEKWLRTVGLAAPLTLAVAFSVWAHPLLSTYLDQPLQKAAAFGFVSANLALFLGLLVPSPYRSAALESVLALCWCLAALAVTHFDIIGATKVLAWRHDFPFAYWVLRIGMMAFPLLVLAAARRQVPGPAMLATVVSAAVAILTPNTSFHSRNLDHDKQVRSAVTALTTHAGEDDLQIARQVWKYVSSEMTHSLASTLRSPDQILADGTGSCGSASKLLAASLRAAGFATRIVNIEGLHGEGHVVVEAYVEGHWRMYDADLKRLYPDESNPMSVLEIAQAYDGHFPDTTLQEIRHQFLTGSGYTPFEKGRETELYARPTESSSPADLPPVHR